MITKNAKKSDQITNMGGLDEEISQHSDNSGMGFEDGNVKVRLSPEDTVREKSEFTLARVLGCCYKAPSKKSYV